MSKMFGANSRNVLWASMAMENDGSDLTGNLGPLDSYSLTCLMI